MTTQSEEEVADEPRPKRTDIVLKLTKKTDREGNLYHIAWCDAPILLDLRECTIFVFTGDNPEISIRRTHIKARPRKNPPESGDE